MHSKKPFSERGRIVYLGTCTLICTGHNSMLIWAHKLPVCKDSILEEFRLSGRSGDYLIQPPVQSRASY